MVRMAHYARRTGFVALFALVLTHSSPSSAQDVMCDPAFEDCHAPLLNLIRTETNSLDVAMWFMEDRQLADAIISRFRAGVEVRALVDPRRNATTPMNATVLAMFKDAGIPMRYKVGGGILHWKYMIFNNARTVQWSAANYGAYYFKPALPYRDYTDEGIYFCRDEAVLNSFRRKFDDAWVDAVGFADYANVASPARAYPLYAIDPAMSFVPAEDFSRRSRPHYDRETERIDVIMYKITEASHADGLLRAVGRGVPVRLITEPDRYRNKDNIWQAYQIDRLHAAGVQIRVRAHAGFLHQKSTLLYSQKLTIYGSSNWTSESNRSQYEHNYFTTKAWFFTWFRNNFERKWANLAGHAETKPFVPLPPDAPVYVAPTNGRTGVAAGTGSTISWRPGSWAHRADVYFGTSSNPPLRTANLSTSPGSTKSYALPALVAGTTYYWRIVSKTAANKEAAGPTYVFQTTGATAPPPQPPPPQTGPATIVLHAAAAPRVGGAWVVEADATAAGGRRLRHPDTGAAKVSSASGSPAHFFEMTFQAQAGRPYRLWIRGKADGNSSSNDSAFVQFSAAVNSSGAPLFRIGTTSATDYNLESCSGCGLSSWGWEDNGWGVGVDGPVLYFATSGTQTIRVQTREDGLSIDQIVLSADTYLTSPPGPTKNDKVVLPAANGG